MPLRKATFVILSLSVILSSSSPLDYDLQPMAVEEMENFLSNPQSQEGLRVEDSNSDSVCQQFKDIKT